MTVLVVGVVMTDAVRPDILSSLQSIREDVQRQVAGLDRYRALKAIDQTIADFPELEDITSSLSGIRLRVQEQLDEMRQFRALRTLDRIMPELSDLLTLIEEPAERDDDRVATRSEDEMRPSGEHSGGAPADTSQQAADTIEVSETASVVFGATTEEQGRDWQHDGSATLVDGSDDVSVHDVSVDDVVAHHVVADDALADAVTADAVAGEEPERTPVRVEAFQPETRPFAMPSLADSVAQLMAQSVSPSPRETHAPPHDHGASEEGVTRPPSTAERAA